MGRNNNYYDEDENEDYRNDPYGSWDMDEPEEGDDIDSDFGNWGND